MYRDKLKAMWAVAEAQHKDSSTRSGKLEKRVYFHYACRAYHTTSVSEEEWSNRKADPKSQ
jgi:hypothetical protein